VCRRVGVEVWGVVGMYTHVWVSSRVGIRHVVVRRVGMRCVDVRRVGVVCRCVYPRVGNEVSRYAGALACRYECTPTCGHGDVEAGGMEVWTCEGV